VQDTNLAPSRYEQGRPGLQVQKLSRNTLTQGKKRATSTRRHRHHHAAGPRANTLIYYPGRAAQTAETILALKAILEGQPWCQGFTPYVSVKSVGQPHTLRAIFDAGLLSDVATIHEARFALWAGKGIITSKDVSFTNLWVGKEDARELVRMGVRRFTLDKKSSVKWIAEAARELGVEPQDIHITLRVLLADTPDQGVKFGIRPEGARDLAVYAKSQGVDVVGVAFHIGTSNSAMFMDPELYGLKLPFPDHELFDNYAGALEAAAPLRNALVAEGLIGPVVNTEGGLRPPYAAPEYDYLDVLRSMELVFQVYYAGPVQWIIEPGRIFAPAAVGKFTVQNVDEDVRAGDYRWFATDGALYTGLHDLQWQQPAISRMIDVLMGRIYTLHSHPERFGPYRVAGYACAGSDEIGYREAYEHILAPEEIQEGDELLLYPLGVYSAGGMSPQSYQMMYGRHRRWYRYHGFNGVQWPNVVAYKPGCRKNGARFPVGSLKWELRRRCLVAAWKWLWERRSW
jgi:diaminopimelate decarboxylase